MFRSLLLFAAVIVVFATRADAAPTPTELNERLIVLVEQLGDAEFHVREEAERELRKVGIPALDALLTASEKDLDFEVRRRAERLVPEIEAAAHAERLRMFLADPRSQEAQTVPGWKRFQTLVGDSLDSRRWFVSMHQAEPLVMLRADQRAERTSAAIGERLADLLRPALRGRTAAMYQLSAPSITALLFIGSRDDVTIHEQVATQVAQVAQGPALSNLLLNSTGDEAQRAIATKVLSQWIKARSQGWTAITNLHLAQRFQLAEAGRSVSRELLGRAGLQSSIRGQALLALERFGNKEDVAIAE
ncbi:MAG: hypothetical protein JNM18_26665, partial [Planctomycetaceae bacterium]|nr:hypothetical protein [Planctomycetaceae bacterium]